MKKKDNKALEINEVEAAAEETAVKEAAEPEIIEEAAEVITEEAAEISAEAPVAAAAAVAGKTTIQKIFCLRNILIAVGVVVVALAAFITIYILNHGASSPEKAAEKYVQAIIDRDGKAANKVLSLAAKNQLFNYNDGKKQATDSMVEKNAPKVFKLALPEADKYQIIKTKVAWTLKSGKDFEKFVKYHDEVNNNDNAIYGNGYGNGTNDKIKQISLVEVVVKEKGSKTARQINVYCAKIGLRWYVLNANPYMQ